nr:hypothetical protein [Tanacetum cinerariifolium]
MERGFPSQKRSGRERGVKEKDLNRNMENTSSGIGVSTDSDATMNADTPIGVASAVQEGVTPSVVDMTGEMKKQNSLDDNNVLKSFPPLFTQVTTEAGSAPGKSSYVNVTSKPSGKKLNIRTLFTPGGRGVMGLMWLSRSMDGLYAMLENGPWFIRNNPLILRKWHPDENLLKEDVNTIPFCVKLHGVPFTAFSDDGLSAIVTKLGTPLMLDCYTFDMCMQSWGRSSYVRVMIELQTDMEMKENIVVAMPKITRKGHYTCNVCVEYEWKPPSSSGNKKKCVEPTIEVSNSNPFDVLNSVDNDVEFGTNGGTSNLGNNEATLSGFSFMNINNDGEFASTTPIGEKIDNIERQIGESKLRLLDNDGNPLVPTGIMESDSEVKVVFDDTANLMIQTSGKDRSDKGYGTNSLLEQ